MDNYWNNEEYNRVHGPNAEGPQAAEDKPQEQTPGDRLARTAMFMGISAIVTTFFTPIFVPGILATMSIVFAVLSKGREQHLSRTGKRALTFGIIGLVVYIGFLGTACVTMYRMVTDPAMRERSNEVMMQFYGYTMDDLLQSIDESYGTDLEILPEEDI